MSGVLFDNICRQKICWLDFMAYLCTKGIPMTDYHYIDQSNLTAQDKDLL